MDVRVLEVVDALSLVVVLFEGEERVDHAVVHLLPVGNESSVTPFLALAVGHLLPPLALSLELLILLVHAVPLRLGELAQKRAPSFLL